MTEVTNDQRADWGRMSLQVFANTVYHGEGDRDIARVDAFEQALGDLLGNLHHYVCQQLGGEHAEEWTEALAEEDVADLMRRLLERGRSYYEEELAEAFAPVYDEEPPRPRPGPRSEECHACDGTGLNDDSHAGAVCETCTGEGKINA